MSSTLRNSAKYRAYLERRAKRIAEWREVYNDEIDRALSGRPPGNSGDRHHPRRLHLGEYPQRAGDGTIVSYCWREVVGPCALTWHYASDGRLLFVSAPLNENLGKG